MAPTMKPKPRKTSTVVKPKANPKRSTPSTKNHRFQPFSERVANVKIDPIRRRRTVDDREELAEETATYFGRSLEEWRDLNLSKTFTAFSREAAPLCDNLPVVLHNEEKIMDLLVSYIEKGDNLSLEPLLSLLSHFARDLDARFEKHFQRAVAAITAVAANHDDPAVIEWSFTRLAWLFKYLSRVLVPDLRPLYDLMSPYLGKRSQKPFIIRFAAESMSFLVRKAAAVYERDPKPLDRIVSHMLEECHSETVSGCADLHHQGIMTLITEVIKGVQGGVHSAGLAVVQSMLKQLANHPISDRKATIEIMVSVLTSLIHHTNAETFQPILETIVDFSDATDISSQVSSIAYGSRLLFTVATVRKGTRISHWTRVLSTLRKMVDLGQDTKDLDYACRFTVMSAVAVTLQSATIDAVLPNLKLLETMRIGQWQPYFLQFCDLFARLGRERFRSFLLVEFQKFILEQWDTNMDATLMLLPKLPVHELKLVCTDALQNSILERLSDVVEVSRDEPRTTLLCRANVVLSAVPHLRINNSTREKLQNTLFELVRTTLERADTELQTFNDFALGPCFATLLEHSCDGNTLRELWPLLWAESSRSAHLPKFWQNMLRYMELFPPTPEDLEGSHVLQLQSSLLECLSLPSHDIRQAALEIMQVMYKARKEAVPDVLSAALITESTPISLETSRNISMNIRRLATGSSNQNLDLLIQKAVATYCFGILHLQLAQAWKDAVDTLETLSKTAVGEGIVTELVQRWLEGKPTAYEPNAIDSQTVLNIDSGGFQVASDFECSNLTKISAICQQTFQPTKNGYPSMQDQFANDTCNVPSISPNAREQALRVLNKILNVAEKRSRMLVPVLLRWASTAEIQGDEELSGHGWSRKDQKAMLAVFAKFKNPKVLFKSEEVYAALLNLCANGDAEIQRSALKAIFAWKESAINLYEERLINLLDEARFREEISVFLQASGDDESTIRVEHQTKLMPVLLRILYGRAVAGGKHGQGSRRKAIFIALSRYGESVLRLFVDIALGSTSSLCLLENGGINEESLSDTHMPLRQQLGMLNMTNDMLETLGADLEPFAAKLLNAVLVYTIAATRQLDSPADSELQKLSLLRSVRQVGMNCLVRIFSSFTTSSYAVEAKTALKELVAPRLDRFALENSQSISGTLRLFSAWSSQQESAPYLVKYIDGLLDRLAELLREPSAKDEVRLFVLQDILDNLLQGNSESVLAEAQITAFARSIGNVLRQQPSKDMLNASVTSLMKLAARILDGQEAIAVIEVSTDLLRKPNKVVSSSTKAELLNTISPLLDATDVPVTPLLYDALCGLFSRLEDRETRTILSGVFGKLCKATYQFSQAAQICEDLNALGGRLDEPDHDRRERGFTMIFEQGRSLTTQQWQPILHNCLFYVRDVDDMANRASSSQALQQFIDAASSRTDGFEPLTLNALLPGIEYGLKDSSELVRAEHLRLLGYLVEKLPDMPAVKDMQCLTVSGDDEASVFTNVLHIQQHRRLRALRRLSEEADHLSTSNVTKFFIPMLEHFVLDQAEGDAGRTLADQATHTIGALARALNWSGFRAVFKRYVGYLTSKAEQETIILRLLSTLVDTLGSLSRNAREVPMSINGFDKTDVVVRDFLPPLIQYIHLKDESTVDRRMPVAVTVVKLLLLSPESEVSSRLAPVLTDVCQILRSRSQEARDQTRKSLSAILALVGPSYLGFILKELRGALQRGSQLHILSYTVHSLLVSVVDSCQPGDLDHCLPQLISIIMDDTFGVTGQEKDSEDYKSGMKEVKSSKSFDTLELLAKITPVQRLGHIIQPLRAFLFEKLDSKTLKKVDDLLARLRKGIDQNPDAGSRDVLILCHEIVRQVHNEQSQSLSHAKLPDCKVDRYLIRAEPSNKSKHKGGTSLQTFKLVSFALELLRKVFRRHEDLLTPTNIAGFLPIAGDALVQGQDEVQLSALKLLGVIMKVPIPDLERNTPVYVNEAVRLIKNATSMTTESAKAALELLTAVLREKRSVIVSDKQIGDVLNALKGDIDEPDRQGIIYKFLRAVLGRKIMATEVYETMDMAGKVIITNPDRNVRESARGAYLQFVLEYPQGKDRWNKQAVFLVENLKYEHPAGRQSVMELLHQLLLRLSDDVFQQLALTLFVALVPVQTSDSDDSCRQMAGMLITKLFERAQDEQQETFLTLMGKWLHIQGNATIQVAALRCWTLALRTKPLPSNRMAKLRNDVGSLLGADQLEWSRDGVEVNEEALQTFDALIHIAPEVAFASESAHIWKRLQFCLTVPQTDIRATIAKLLQSCFSHLASSSSKAGFGLSSVPLRGSHGLEMSVSDMRQICHASVRVLRAEFEQLSESLATETVRNLVFIGRCFAANKMNWRPTAGDSSDDDQDENKSMQQGDPSALAYLFNRLSYIIRQEGLPTTSRIAAIQCQAALVNHVAEVPLLETVIRPLYLLTDPAIPQPSDESHKTLVERARELLEVLQQKVGGGLYLSALAVARSEAKSRREDRRTKRRIDAVSAPERWAREKRKKYENKKLRTKSRAVSAMGKRRGW